jgi:WD40 repeat protein
MENSRMTPYHSLSRLMWLSLCMVIVTSGSLSGADKKKNAVKQSPPEFSKHIAPILKRYCVGCHNAKDKEGKLNLESFQAMMKGGENGRIFVPGNLAKSKLVGMIERKTEPVMPPEGNEAPSKKEIDTLKFWITAGAKGPTGIAVNTLVTPNIRPLGKVRRPINAMAASSDGKWLAVGRHATVEILSTKTMKLARRLTGHRGSVTALVFSADGNQLFVGAGEPGLYGQATLWRTSGWKLVKQWRGHHDSIYAIAISPDGKTLATGSYDRTIQLWNAKTGENLKSLTGHNGPVNGLSFHPSSKLLASASGDRTVKLWSVKTGKRLDTLGQSEKAQNAVSFSPNGRFVVSGGVDNRLRVWRINSMGREGTNPLLHSRFAHEMSILSVVFSPNGQTIVTSGEDRTVKIWKTSGFSQLRSLKAQSDWSVALAISSNNGQLFVGRMDGSLSRYPLVKNQGGAKTIAAVHLSPTPKSHESANLKPLPKLQEREPNNDVKQATRLKVPITATGVLSAVKGDSVDVDLYRFSSRKGQAWIIETNAARSKSLADTKIEILHPDGRPVLRYLLRAVRDSYITFRPIDSRQSQVRVKNWEEMKLNQYLYMGGEVGRLFRAPRGPDSGFEFYTQGGKRRCYFDTSATVHAKESPVYIVEPYPAGAKLVENGLPVFPLFYANDDDGERKLGNDSRLTFTAPKEGEYLVRVTDVRGEGGEKYKYSLTIREPKPDFQVTLKGKNATIGAGSGQRLSVSVNRIDGVNGEVRVEVTGLPKGFTVTSPIILEPDHLSANGVIHISDQVTITVQPKPAKTKGKTKNPTRARKPVKNKTDWSKVRVTATGWINGKKVVKALGTLGQLKVAAAPKVRVWLEVDTEVLPKRKAGNSNELVIAPGTTITAMLRIERKGFNGDLKFDVDHLPHGVIVDNIGLSGILVRAGETRRRVYLTAADWVGETTHGIHAVGIGQGNQATLPITLHVRKNREVKNTTQNRNLSDKVLTP